MRNMSILLVLSVAAVIGCIFGVGYASEYTATTSNTDNTLQATYMVLELNDNAVTSECTFNFDDLVYYRDRAVIGGTISDVYRFVSAESDMVKVWIKSTPTDEVDTTMTVRLRDPVDTLPVLGEENGQPVTVYVDVATIVLQFYHYVDLTEDDIDNGDWVPYGDPVTMTDDDKPVSTGQSPKVFTTDTEYRCKATITLSDEALNVAIYGVDSQHPGNGTGEISFDIIFTATAEVIDV